eukprot:2416789-Rhodomonas_salina.3
MALRAWSQHSRPMSAPRKCIANVDKDANEANAQRACYVSTAHPVANTGRDTRNAAYASLHHTPHRKRTRWHKKGILQHTHKSATRIA